MLPHLKIILLLEVLFQKVYETHDQTSCKYCHRVTCGLNYCKVSHVVGPLRISRPNRSHCSIAG